MVPFYSQIDLPIGAVLTDNGREFCGTEHRRTRVCTPKTNGFVARFNSTVLGEFFRIAMPETF